MKTALAAVVVSVTMLSGAVLSSAGMAQAADMEQADTQKDAGITKYSKPEDSKSVGRMVLNDDQMKEITAGHLTWPGNPLPHLGLYRDPITGHISYGIHIDFAHDTLLK
jgi:hypothetical protein